VSATDRERLTAQQAEAQAQQPKSRLIHARPSGQLLLITLEGADGVVRMIRATTADTPELATLPEADRSRLCGMFLCLHQQQGPDAA